MTYRTFKDSHGIEWQVWDVKRVPRERRGRADRRRASIAAAKERRLLRDRRMPVSPGLEQGWLAFASRAEKRRFYPVPESWPEIPEGELRSLLDRAMRVESKGRLIE